MAPYRIDFEALEWERPAAGVRFKAVRRDGLQVRLVEFSPELSHPHWCTAGHAGTVLQGELELTFDRETLCLHAGDGLLVPAGEAHRHIPRAVGGPVLLLLVEDAPGGPG